MRKKTSRLLSGVLSITMLLSLCTAGFAEEMGGSGSGGDGPPGPPGGNTSTTTFYTKSAGDWGYRYSETVNSSGEVTDTSNAAIIYARDTVKDDRVTLVPGELGGHTVTTFGSGSSSVMSNNKVVHGYVLFADSITTISKTAVYDYNSTEAWSMPGVTAMASNSFTSCANGKFYGIAGGEVASLAGDDFVEVSASNTVTFRIEATGNGAVVQAGTYAVPTEMLAQDYSAPIHVSADLNYKIDSIFVDGVALDLSEIAEPVQEYEFNYPFTVATRSIIASFVPLDEGETESRELSDEFVYDAPILLEGAVADGATLPDDVYAYAPLTDGEAPRKYSSTMGVMTGTYYAVDGELYRMVDISQDTCYLSKAEVINAMKEKKGYVFGRDYDYIRLFNYVHDYDRGPRPGDFELYCCYLYKSVGDDTLSDVQTNAEWERAYEHVNSTTGVHQTIQGDVATVLVEKGDPVTINNLVSHNNTIPYGPSEAANFYGLGSAILVDGGDTEASGEYLGQIRDYVDAGKTAVLTLNNPTITGVENVIYAVAGGVGHLNGGRYFGASSGGHGLYVGMGGQLTLNANQENGILDENGVVQTDCDYLKETVLDTRPAMDLGKAVGTELSQDWNAYAKPEFNELAAADGGKTEAAILVTADETGTALTTDTGGGTIVANRLSATTYGRGCAGVYSIGGDESLVYVYNSALHSNADSALCSASCGYIFAFNCELQGVAGIKTRSGGSGDKIGVTVYNSKVTSAFEPENYDFYHMATDADTWEEWQDKFGSWMWADDTSLVNCPMLNLFINKTAYAYGQDISKEMSYWYQDKNTAPQTGEAMACILATGTAPIYSHSNYYVNQNYLTHKDDRAKNYLIAADNAGTAEVYFYDQNSKTPWDLTNKSTETTELSGDIWIAETVTMTGPDAGKGPSTAKVHFKNSEWTGTVVGYTPNSYLSFDGDSVWTVTADTTITGLTLAAGAVIKCDSFTYDSVTANEDGTFTFSNAKLTAYTEGHSTATLSTYMDTAGSEVDSDVSGAVLYTTKHLSDTALGSYTSRGQDDYRTALYVKDGELNANSIKELLKGATITSSALTNGTLKSYTDTFNGVIIKNSDYTISGLNISMESGSDGSTYYDTETGKTVSFVSDFAGLGAAVAVYGAGNDTSTKLTTITGAKIATTGAAKLAVFVDDGANAVIRSSNLRVEGGDLYDGYESTADQTKMVAPPWVLGIAGNARTTNLMGRYSTATYIDSRISADGWGALSTDACKSPVLTAVNSTVVVGAAEPNSDGSYTTTGHTGYGTYAIGSAAENFYGVTFYVPTFVTISAGGTMNYGAYTAGEEISIDKADSAKTHITSVKSDTAKGIRKTLAYSNQFGVMFHTAGGTVNLTDGTEFHTGNAVFLAKAGAVNVNVDNAVIRSEDGVLFQVMDNDDDLVGVTMPDGYDGPVFKKSFTEQAGWSSGWTVDPGSSSGGNQGGGPGGEGGPGGPGGEGGPGGPGGSSGGNTATFKNVALNGNLYNASGYGTNDGKGRTLDITLGQGAVLNGVISATEYMHAKVNQNGDYVDAQGNVVTVDKAIQNANFTVDEYYGINHIINRPYYNGSNDVNVTLKSGSSWTVTGTCILTDLTVESGATLNANVSETTDENGDPIYILTQASATGGVVSKTTYTITAAAGVGGSVSPTSSIVTKGGRKVFTITADKGYTIADVLVDGKSVGAVSSYTFASVTANHAISATFTKEGGSTESGTEGSLKFTDVAENSWYYAAVNFVLAQGLFTGTSDTTFDPDTNMSRAMLAAVLYRLAGSPSVSGLSRFTDVGGGTWYSDSVLWASENNIVSGYGDGTFGTDQNVTRQELAVMLYRMAGSPAVSFGSLSGYGDRGDMASWAGDALAWAVETGLMTGTVQDTLSPNATATRAEVATMLMRYVQNLAR